MDGASAGSKVTLFQSLLVRGKKMRQKHGSYKMVQSAAVTSCARRDLGGKGQPMDIHLVVKYAVHHNTAVLTPSFFQHWLA